MADDRRSDAFLQGQGIPVDLREIETTLQQLWGPAAELVGGPEPEHPQRHADRAGEPRRRAAGAGRRDAPRRSSRTVITRYPCRAIVVRGVDDAERTDHRRGLGPLPPARPGHAPGLLRADRAPRRARGRGPHPRRGPAAARGRPADGALVDRPTPGRTRPSSATWATSARGCSSTCPTRAPRPPRCALGLDPAICPCSRDTAWFGLTRWRELVAQFFDPPCHHETLNRVDSLQIEALSPDPSSPAPPGDLAGGLAGGAARLEAAGTAGQPGHLLGQLVPRGVPGPARDPGRGDRHRSPSPPACRRRR